MAERVSNLEWLKGEAARCSALYAERLAGCIADLESAKIADAALVEAQRRCAIKDARIAELEAQLQELASRTPREATPDDPTPVSREGGGE